MQIENALRLFLPESSRLRSNSAKVKVMVVSTSLRMVLELDWVCSKMFKKVKNFALGALLPGPTLLLTTEKEKKACGAGIATAY